MPCHISKTSSSWNTKLNLCLRKALTLKEFLKKSTPNMPRSWLKLRFEFNYYISCNKNHFWYHSRWFKEIDHLHSNITHSKFWNCCYRSFFQQNFVEQYEAIVNHHQEYCKAVMEIQEWVEATHNTVLLWGDTDLERVSIHTNLERLKVRFDWFFNEFYFCILSNQLT